MAKKTNKPANISGGAAPPQPVQLRKPQVQQPSKQEQTNTLQKPVIQWLIAGGIALLTWMFFKVCLDNQITNWDDPGYIKDNPLIKDVSAEGIKNIFSTSVMGNYHPLTILSYAIEYSYVQLKQEFYYVYHRDSVLLHIAVTLFVFWFVNVLTKRPIAAIVAALLFGLHPMHVESVAWLAGRKDVLYGLFYVAALVAYVYYIRAEGSRKWVLYAVVLALFVCSLLSKPVAVVLPVVLLLIDYYNRKEYLNIGFINTFPGSDDLRKFYVAVVEKIPLFAIAIYFGLRSVSDQKQFGALGTQNVTYSFGERIALGGYAFVTYLWKALLPRQLSCFYPYPIKVNGVLPFTYYLFPVAVLVILGLLVWAFLRKKKVIVFGSMFFLVNIVLLLQFIPVGGAILADRYTYIPYLGLFFMAGWWVSGYFEQGAKIQIGYAALAVVLAYSLYLGYLSNERCKAWYDTSSLWRDEIEQQPDAPNAYNNLGFEYFNKFNDSVDVNKRKIYYDSSYQLLNKAISLQKDFVNPYISLGELERSTGQWGEAKKNYYKALSLNDKSENANAYLGLAIIYAINNNFDSAAFCFRSALKEKPYFPEAVSNYGNFLDMTGKTDSAIIEYGVAIAQNPDMYAPLLNRGRALMRKNKPDEALKDFNRAIELYPQMGEIYYARASAYAAKGNNAQAQQDGARAQALGYRPPSNAHP
jgi:tetratricopeptide (TPR) repeat protein